MASDLHTCNEKHASLKDSFKNYVVAVQEQFSVSCLGLLVVVPQDGMGPRGCDLLDELLHDGCAGLHLDLRHARERLARLLGSQLHSIPHTQHRPLSSGGGPVPAPPGPAAG